MDVFFKGSSYHVYSDEWNHNLNCYILGRKGLCEYPLQDDGGE